MRFLPLVLLAGCAIADRSDKFGADFDIGVGGILSYIADFHLKGSVGFSKTCKENDNGKGMERSGGSGLLDFL